MVGGQKPIHRRLAGLLGDRLEQGDDLAWDAANSYGNSIILCL